MRKYAVLFSVIIGLLLTASAAYAAENISWGAVKDLYMEETHPDGPMAKGLAGGADVGHLDFGPFPFTLPTPPHVSGQMSLAVNWQGTEYRVLRPYGAKYLHYHTVKISTARALMTLWDLSIDGLPGLQVDLMVERGVMKERRLDDDLEDNFDPTTQSVYLSYRRVYPVPDAQTPNPNNRAQWLAFVDLVGFAPRTIIINNGVLVGLRP